MIERTPDHQYSHDGGPHVPGVTSIIGMKDKSWALVGWAKRETAACAIRNLDALVAMRAAGGERAAVDWLRGIPDHQRDTSADLGSRVHAAIESWSTRGELVGEDTDVTPYLDTFQRDFVDRFKPTFRAVEAYVFSEAYGYGGTLDAICVIEGETWLIDHKTGRGIYPETAMQLAALAHADVLGYPGDRQDYAIPRIDRYGVVHIGPDRTYLREYHVGRDELDTFLHLLAVHRWQATRSKEVMGDTL